VSLGNRVGRCALVWMSVTAAMAGLIDVLGPWAIALRTAVSPAGATPFDRALPDLAAAGLLVCAGWAWLTTSAVVVEVLRGRVGSGTSSGVPAGLRRVVLAACGVALAGGLGHPAYAASGQPHRPTSVVARLTGLPLPDLVATGRRPGHHPRRHPRQHQYGGATQVAERIVVVAPGDTLWSIAARNLPPGCRAEAISGYWRAIYAENHAAIGPDPDLIEPGIRIHLPGEEHP
jgi:hypothetical protein